MITEAVAGFLFSKDHGDVALIRKIRPNFQAGRLNAIGGHIEPDETPLGAMIREFKEETGVNEVSWEKYLELFAGTWRVHFFRAFSDDIYKVKTMTDERVNIWCANDIPLLHTMSNLKWLVPMALDLSIKHAVVAEKSAP